MGPGHAPRHEGVAISARASAGGFRPPGEFGQGDRLGALEGLVTVPAHGPVHRPGDHPTEDGMARRLAGTFHRPEVVAVAGAFVSAGGIVASVVGPAGGAKLLVNVPICTTALRGVINDMLEGVVGDNAALAARLARENIGGPMRYANGYPEVTRR